MSGVQYARLAGNSLRHLCPCTDRVKDAVSLSLALLETAFCLALILLLVIHWKVNFILLLGFRNMSHTLVFFRKHFLESLKRQRPGFYLPSKSMRCDCMCASLPVNVYRFTFIIML